MPYHPHQRKQLACLRQQVKSLLGLSVYGNSNTDLEEALEVNSVPSSVWSHKLQRTFRKIQTSKRHVLKKLNISKTHFYRLTKHGRMGYVVYKGRRHDTCPCCYAWDTHLSKLIIKAYADAETALSCQCNHVLNSLKAPSIDYPRCESPSYLRSWLECIQDHIEKEHPGCPATDVAAVAMHELQGFHDDLEAMNFHWWLKDFLRQQYESHIDKPLQSWVYMCHDFMAPLT